MSFEIKNNNLNLYAGTARVNELYVNGSKVMLNTDGSVADYGGNIQASTIRFNNNDAVVLHENDVVKMKQLIDQPIPSDIVIDSLRFNGGSRTFVKDSFEKMDTLSPHLLERQYKLIELDDNINIDSVNNVVTMNRPLKIGNYTLNNDVFDLITKSRNIDNTVFPSLSVGGVGVTGGLMQNLTNLANKVQSQTDNDIVYGNGVSYVLKHESGASERVDYEAAVKDRLVRNHTNVNAATGKVHSFITDDIDTNAQLGIDYNKIQKLDALQSVCRGDGSKLRVVDAVKIQNSDNTATVDLTYNKILNYDAAIGSVQKRVIDVNPTWLTTASNMNYTNCVFRIDSSLDFTAMQPEEFSLQGCSFVGCDFILCSKYTMRVGRSELANCRFIRDTREGIPVDDYLYNGNTYFGSRIDLFKSRLVNIKTTSAANDDTVLQEIVTYYDDCELVSVNTRTKRVIFKYSLRAVNCQFRLKKGFCIVCEAVSGEIGDSFISAGIICYNVDELPNRALTINNCAMKGWDRFMGSTGSTSVGFQDSHHAAVYIHNSKYTVILNSCIFSPEFDPNVYMNDSIGPLAAGSTGHFFGFVSANKTRVTTADSVIMIRNCTLDLRGIVGAGRSRIMNIASASELYNRPAMWLSNTVGLGSNTRAVIGYQRRSLVQDLGGNVGQVTIRHDDYFGNEWLI